MVKIFETAFPYDYSYPHVISSLFQKYPNPYAAHVTTVDTLSRTVDPVTGVMRTERVIGVKQGVPKWVMRLLGVTENAFVREVVFVDPANKTTTMMSVNLSLSQYIQCLELITYTPITLEPAPARTSRSRAKASPVLSRIATMTAPATPADTSPDAPATLFSQRAHIASSFSSRLVADKLEKSSVERFGMNAERGKVGFEWILSGQGE